MYCADAYDKGWPPLDGAMYPLDGGMNVSAFEFEPVGLSVPHVESTFRRYRAGPVQHIDGWFNESLARISSPALALLRLDGDLQSRWVDWTALPALCGPWAASQSHNQHGTLAPAAPSQCAARDKALTEEQQALLGYQTLWPSH